MAVLQFVAVMDLAISAYQRPLVVPHPGMAVRGFLDEVKREGSELQKHPEDYELHRLGEFDEDTGMIAPAVNGPVVLIRGKDAALSK